MFMYQLQQIAAKNKISMSNWLREVTFSPQRIIIIYIFKSLPAHKQKFKWLCKQMKF